MGTDLQHLGVVDDLYASFDWSQRVIVNAHIAFWIVGSPRIDKDQVPKQQHEESEGNLMEMDVPIDAETNMPQEEAASLMAALRGSACTERNLARAIIGAYTSTVAEPADKVFTAVAAATGPRIQLHRKLEREMPSLNSLSHKTMRHCLLGGLAKLTFEEEEDRCWQELDQPHAVENK